MEKDVDEVKNIALAAKSKLEDLDKDNLTNRSKPGCGKGSSIDRSRTTATVTLKEKWKQKVFDFQKLREDIQKEHRDVVARTVFTVTGSHADVEVIDQLIQTGNSGQIYQKVIQEQGRGQVMDTLAEIQNRYETLTEIEKQLLELQQIFLDMSVLVEVQGDMLDNIESQVSSAVEDVKKGADALHQTRKMKHQTYKWMWMTILVFILVAIVTVIAVLKPWKHL
ncbi:syntaxin-132-like isoform X2 [Asparagus officinalis]|nr:syntaxin-132-like isoform X2 [Asparagus officinalis]